MTSANNQITPTASSQILFTAVGDAAATLQFPALAIRLNHTNYSLRHGTIRSVLEAYELEGFLVPGSAPSETLPPAQGSKPNHEYAAWKRKDRLVLLWVRSTLTAPMLGHVARAVSTADDWTMLAQMFQLQTRAREMHLKQQLQLLTKGSLTIMEYVGRKRTISDALAECLTTVSDEDFVSFVLFGLGPEYVAFKTALSMQIDHVLSNELFGAAAPGRT